MSASAPRHVLVLDGLTPESCDVLRGLGGAWDRMAERGLVTRLHPQSKAPVPEAAWFGLDPLRLALAPGPLTVAGLGADPPDRSVHFCLTLMSVEEDGVMSEVEVTTAPVELTAAMSRLATPRLTPLCGPGATHGLVWEEGSLDLGTVIPAAAAGLGYMANLPQGDGEAMLRRFVDDSVNLLSAQPFNRVRSDQGLPPLNLLWPWGHGMRGPTPNLALLRGRVVMVHSGSLRTKGLARLVGFRHGDENKFCPALFPSVESLSRVSSSMDSLVVLDLGPFVRHDRLDQLAYALRDVGTYLLERWLGTEESPAEALVLATGSGEGLCLRYRSWSPREDGRPFDSRLLGDPKVPVGHAFEAVASA